jgi:hypothetical protein
MLKYPLVFLYNVLEDQYAVYRSGLFDHLKLIFEQEDKKCLFLPIRNSKFSHMEGRVEKIDRELRKIGPAHIIALSVAGVDCRLASSLKDTPMKTLFTVSSPHRGSFMADYALTNGKEIHNIDPIFKLIGIPYYAFTELETGKMRSLNKAYPSSRVPVYSTSSWRLKKDCSDLLKRTSQIMQHDQEVVHKWNDGLFYVNEMKWGDHLLSFDGDHSHVFGSSLKVNCGPIYRLAIDNAIRFERHEEGKVATLN